MNRFIQGKVTVRRLAIITAVILLIAVSWWRVFEARTGLVVRPMVEKGVPMRYIGPAGVQQVPGVLIAHGFGTSQQIMLGFGYALAHSGYGVLLWDFAGHAANPAKLDLGSAALQNDLDAAYRQLVSQPEMDADRVALLGHSMGGGAVLEAAVREPDRYRATIAVSPVETEVSPDAPRNLLLLAGEWEPLFADNAARVLAQAGGESRAFDDGRARSLTIVPQVEHILILFSPTTHEAAVNWLDQVFSRESASGYQDRRILWFGASLLGWMLLIAAASPLIPAPAAPLDERTRYPWRGLSFFLSPLAAAGALASFSRIIDVSRLGGLVVGGALGLWFLLMGVTWLVTGFRPPRPARHDLWWGLSLFGFLWVAFGLLAQVVWFPWMLIPARLLRWPLMALAFLPWTLATGIILQRASWRKRLGWWLGQSVWLTASLILVVRLVPSLFVLVLVVPVLSLLFGIMFIAGSALDRPWSYGIGNALFFGWLVMAFFPIAS